MYAPVALFVYNRPDHTARTIDALGQNDLAAETELFIFADGVKPNSSREDVMKVGQVQELIQSVRGFKKVNCFIAPENNGLARSVTNGISKVLDVSDTVIVLEDDLIVSKEFLKFCNQGLDKYRHDERVAGVSGYMYPVAVDTNESFFLPVISCWGWATWKRAWKLYENDSSMLLKKVESSGQVNRFELNASYPYMQMLRSQASGKISSWAINWYASLFLQSRLMLYPPSTLVYNSGMDGSGTHFTGFAKITPPSVQVFVEQSVISLPDVVHENKKIQRKVEAYLRQLHYPKFKDKILRKLKRSFQ